MKQKRLAQIFLAISLLCISPIPLTNLLVLYRHNLLKSENITVRKLFNIDRIEADVNYYAYRTLHRSFMPHKVVVGKDGYLFLGNKYASVIDKIQGTFLYTHNEVERWVTGLLNIQKWFMDRNIPFAFVIAPNKSSVYPEELPTRITYNERKTITDVIVKTAKEKGIFMLDLRPILRAHKDEGLLYFKTDTHWNNKGASVAFDETIRFVNEKYGLKLRIPDYRLRETREGSGDLAVFLKIKKILSPHHELNFAYDFNQSISVCHGLIDAKDRSLHKCETANNPILNVFVEDQYMINNNAENPEKLLFIGDSFSVANSKPYNATFGTLWKFHHSRLYGKKLADFVKKNQPDIAIYQIVERDLYLPTLIKPLQ